MPKPIDDKPGEYQPSRFKPAAFAPVGFTRKTVPEYSGRDRVARLEVVRDRFCGVRAEAF